MDGNGKWFPNMVAHPKKDEKRFKKSFVRSLLLTIKSGLSLY